MQAAQQFRLVLCTVGKESDAVRVSRALVTAKLAACVNIVPKVRSIYQWEGSICDDQELLLVIKTKNGNVDELEKMIQKLHPYDVPEILSVPLDRGSAPYLRWLAAETKTKERK